MQQYTVLPSNGHRCALCGGEAEEWRVETTGEKRILSSCLSCFQEITGHDVEHHIHIDDLAFFKKAKIDATALFLKEGTGKKVEENMEVTVGNKGAMAYQRALDLLVSRKGEWVSAREIHKGIKYPTGPVALGRFLSGLAPHEYKGGVIEKKDMGRGISGIYRWLPLEGSQGESVEVSSFSPSRVIETNNTTISLKVGDIPIQIKIG